MSCDKLVCSCPLLGYIHQSLIAFKRCHEGLFGGQSCHESEVRVKSQHLPVTTIATAGASRAEEA